VVVVVVFVVLVLVLVVVVLLLVVVVVVVNGIDTAIRVGKGKTAGSYLICSMAPSPLGVRSFTCRKWRFSRTVTRWGGGRIWVSHWLKFGCGLRRNSLGS